MDEITRIPTERPTYRELKVANTRLKRSLYEAEQSQKKAEQLAMLLVVLFAVTAVLLVLTWSGRIVI